MSGLHSKHLNSVSLAGPTLGGGGGGVGGGTLIFSLLRRLGPFFLGGGDGSEK